MLLLQGFSQFRDGGLRRLLLLHGRIDRLLRLRGLGLDLAACSRKLARECRGTRLCLVERAALLLGACRHRLARRADLLGEGGGLLLLLLQGFSQFGSGGLRRLLLLHGFIDSLLRLRGLGLDLAACSRKLARECRGTRLCLVERAALLLGACRHRLARRADLLGEGGGLLLLLLQGFSQFGSGGLRRLLLLQGFIDSLLRLRGLGLDLTVCSRKLARECRGTGLFLLKGLPQLLRRDFRCLAALYRFVMRLGRQCHRRLQVDVGFRQLPRQSGGSFAFLVQRLLQFGRCSFRRPP